ncbi:MAG: tRNA (adenosine(37)-N6)-threonylcarbamoyltransferase complex dimerization subunit type 1 TsaB [Nitrospirae bacterium]|nr:tRNA (adenosine(37)-N6)-threonylcarbamoyltransferase complex dimerization subunit type 1 TsaB [Nitrospirota bacterium]
MLTLAVDTSTPVGGVSLYGSDSGLVGEVRLGIRQTHSEQLMKAVDFLLKSSKTGIDEIDFYTIAIGPGSFTGLRVGLSTVKGLSFATGRPVAAVSTLEAFASSLAFTEKLICPLLDARKKEVYGGLFRWTGEGLQKVAPEAALDIRSILALINEETVFAGSGAILYKDVIMDILGESARFPHESLMHPLPTALAAAGLHKAERGEFSDPVTLTPVYLRRSEAELKTKT